MLIWAHNMANKYELLYTLPAKYTEGEANGVKANITSELEKLGLSISRNEEIGKIKLGYPMQHVRHGHYVLVVFEAEPASLAKLNEYMRLNNEVLRHQVTHFDPAVKPIVALADPEARLERREAVPSRVESGAPEARPVAPTGPAMTEEELEKKLSALEEDITKAL
jgi:small subunit ribosomal protein S6